MDELMNSMKDAILSLTDGLEALGKECYMAGENYQHQNKLQLLVSEFRKLTTSPDYKCKHELLMSECRKLTQSFHTIIQQAWELTVALRANEVETKNMPLSELAVEHNMASSYEKVEHNTAAHACIAPGFCLTCGPK